MEILDAYSFDEKMTFDDLVQGFQTIEIAFVNPLANRTDEQKMQFIQLLFKSLEIKQFTKLKFEKTLMNFIATYRFDKFQIADFLNAALSYDCTLQPNEHFKYAFKHRNGKIFYFRQENLESDLTKIFSRVKKQEIEVFDAPSLSENDMELLEKARQN